MFRRGKKDGFLSFYAHFFIKSFIKIINYRQKIYWSRKLFLLNTLFWIWFLLQFHGLSQAFVDKKDIAVLLMTVG